MPGQLRNENILLQSLLFLLTFPDRLFCCCLLFRVFQNHSYCFLLFLLLQNVIIFCLIDVVLFIFCLVIRSVLKIGVLELISYLHVGIIVRLNDLHMHSFIPVILRKLGPAFLNPVVLCGIGQAFRCDFNEQLPHGEEVIALVIVTLVNQFLGERLLELLSLQDLLLEGTGDDQSEDLYLFLLALPPNSAHHLAVIAGVPIRFDHYHLAGTGQCQTSSSSLARKQQHLLRLKEALNDFEPLLAVYSSIEFRNRDLFFL